MSSPSTPTDLQYLTIAPGTLVTDAVAALIDPSSNVTIDELICQPVPGGQVVITPTTLAYADPTWPYYGHAIAQYDLLDLANTFDGIDLNLTIDQIPSRSGDMATLLNSIFDVLLIPDDVVDVQLPTILGGGTPFTLQASPNSLMWKGSVSMRLWPTSVATTDLTDWVIHTELLGLMPPAASALPEANSDWVSTISQGVLRFRAGACTINEGDILSSVGIIGPSFAAMFPPGNIEGDYGDVEGGLPAGVDVSITAISNGSQQQTQMYVYLNGSATLTYSDRWVQLIDSKGIVYYDGQLSAISTVPMSATIVPGEYALILQPRDVEYANLNLTDDWSIQAAVTFRAYNNGGYATGGVGPGGSTLYTPNYYGFVTLNGYTYTAQTAYSSAGQIIEGSPPSDTVLDAVIYQTPNADAPPTPVVPTGLIINFVTAPDTSPFTLSDKYSARTAKIIDSRGTLYWSGVLGDVGGTTALVPVGSDGGQVLPLTDYNIYALVVDP